MKAVRSPKVALATLRQAPLGLKRRPESPVLPVSTPWGDVLIRIKLKDNIEVRFGNFVVNGCTMLGYLTLRKYTWQDQWLAHSYAQSTKRNGNPKHWAQRPLTRAQRDLLLQKLVPWLIAWITRNKVVLELDDELGFFRRYWDELEKDDPNGRPY